MLPKIDHYAAGLLERSGLEENVVYNSLGVERVIPLLREGDEVRIQREGKSYGQLELWVVGSESDDAIVQDEDGNEYRLVKSHYYNEESWPWLRKDGNSAGRVERLTITHLET